MIDLDEIRTRRAIYPGQTGEQRADFIVWAPLDIDTLLAEVERLTATLDESRTQETMVKEVLDNIDALVAEVQRLKAALDESRELEPKTVQCEFCEMEILAKNVVRIGSHHHALCVGCAATYRIQETKDDESPF